MILRNVCVERQTLLMMVCSPLQSSINCLLNCLRPLFACCFDVSFFWEAIFYKAKIFLACGAKLSFVCVL